MPDFAIWQICAEACFFECNQKLPALLSQRYLFIAIRTAATASPTMMATSHLAGSRWSNDGDGPLTSPPAVHSARALGPRLTDQRKVTGSGEPVESGRGLVRLF